MHKITLIIVAFAIILIGSISYYFLIPKCEICSKNPYSVREIVNVNEHPSGNLSSILILYKSGKSDFTFRVECLFPPNTKFKSTIVIDTESNNYFLKKYGFTKWSGLKEVVIEKFIKNKSNGIYECKAVYA